MNQLINPKKKGNNRQIAKVREYKVLIKRNQTIKISYYNAIKAYAMFAII